MAIKRILCQNCSSYDKTEQKCNLGKTNPRKKHETFTLVELLGVQSLCMHNPWREELLLRMYRHPKSVGYMTTITSAIKDARVDLEWIDNG